MNRRIRTSLCLIILVLVVSSGVSCKMLISSTNVKLSLDEKKNIEKKMTAAKGGSIKIKVNGMDALVTFPPNALSKDMTIIVTPLIKAPEGLPGAINPGFIVTDKATGDAPEIRKPVMVGFTAAKKDIGAVIVHYSPETDTFEVLKPIVINSDTSDSYLASIASFSNIGLYDKDVEKSKKKSDKAPKQEYFSNDLSVDSDSLKPRKQVTEAGTMTITSHLKLKADCSKAAGWSGKYEGTADLVESSTFVSNGSFQFLDPSPYKANLSGLVEIYFDLPSSPPLPPMTKEAQEKFVKDQEALAPLVEQEQKAGNDSELLGIGWFTVSEGGAAFNGVAIAENGGGDAQASGTAKGKIYPIYVLIDPSTGKLTVDMRFGMYIGTATGTIIK